MLGRSLLIIYAFLLAAAVLLGSTVPLFLA